MTVTFHPSFRSQIGIITGFRSGDILTYGSKRVKKISKNFTWPLNPRKKRVYIFSPYGFFYPPAGKAGKCKRCSDCTLARRAHFFHIARKFKSQERLMEESKPGIYEGEGLLAEPKPGFTDRPMP